MFQSPDLPAVLPPSSKAKPRRHAEWLKLIGRWQTSGLSEQAFCDSIGVKADTFRKHRYQANKAARKKTAARTGFNAVKLTKLAKPAALDQAAIVLHASHCRLELPRDMDVSQVAELVNALGR